MAMNLDAVLRLVFKTEGEGELGRAQTALLGVEKAGTKAKSAFTGVVSSTTWQAAAAAAAGVGVALVTSVSEAIKFESAMADVKKVVAGLDDPTSLREMKSAIIDLSRELPITAEGLTQIVAAAGQAGIAKDELLDFARSAAQMGIAFDITADQAGEAMAKLRTSMGLSQSEVVNLADAMNHLSNVQASTASEITDFMLRVGAFGQQVAMTEEQTAALGSAMIAAGAAPEVAATSFRNLIKEMASGETATAKQEDAWERLGLTAVDVAKMMQTDAVGTIRDVFQRLAQLPAEIQIPTIEALFGNEARALTPLIKNMNLFEESLAAVGDQSNYAGSMLKEFEARSGTTANQIQLFQNNVKALQIEIGSALLPALNAIVGALLPIVSGISQAAGQFPMLTTAVVALAAAFSGLVLALPFIASALSIMGSLGAMGITLGAAFATLAGWLGALGPAFAALSFAVKAALAVVAGFVSWPVLVIAGLVAAGAAIYVFRDQIVDGLKNATDAIAGWVDSLWQWGAPIRQAWASIWQVAQDAAMQFFGWIAGAIQQYYVQPWLDIGSKLVDAASTTWDAVKAPILGFFGWWGSTLYQLFIEPWVNAWLILSQAAQGVWEAIKATASGFWAWWTGAVSQYIVQPWMTAWASITKTAQGVWEGIKSAASGFFGWWADTLYKLYVEPWVKIGGTLANAARSAWDGVRAAVMQFFGWIAGAIQQYYVQPFVAAGTMLAAGSMAAMGQILAAWSSFGAAFGTALSSVGAAFDQYVIDPIKSAWQALQTWMQAIVTGGAQALQRAYQSIASAVTGAFQGVVNSVGNILNQVIVLINKLIDGINTVRSAAGLSSIGKIGLVAIPSFATGGFVKQPTVALVGEGGEPEYIVPASKMAAASANYLAGARGDAVLSSAPSVMSATKPASSRGGSGPVQINITTGPVMESEGRRWVTVEDLQAAAQQTATQIYATLRTPAGRRAIGVS